MSDSLLKAVSETGDQILLRIALYKWKGVSVDKTSLRLQCFTIKGLVPIEFITWLLILSLFHHMQKLLLSATSSLACIVKTLFLLQIFKIIQKSYYSINSHARFYSVWAVMHLRRLYLCLILYLFLNRWLHLSSWSSCIPWCIKGKMPEYVVVAYVLLSCQH